MRAEMAVPWRGRAAGGAAGAPAMPTPTNPARVPRVATAKEGAGRGPAHVQVGGRGRLCRAATPAAVGRPRGVVARSTSCWALTGTRPRVADRAKSGPSICGARLDRAAPASARILTKGQHELASARRHERGQRSPCGPRAMGPRGPGACAATAAEGTGGVRSASHRGQAEFSPERRYGRRGRAGAWAEDGCQGRGNIPRARRGV